MSPGRGIAFIVRSNPPPETNVTVHRAGRVILDPWNILENGYVHVRSGEIVEAGKGRGPKTAGAVIDHGPGTMMPGLVNSHTHLELSALKGKTETGKGLIAWVESVIRLRDEIASEELMGAAANGFSEIEETGTILIGEISTTGITRTLFQKHALSGVWFQEFLGSLEILNEKDDGFFDPYAESEKRFSVAGHAPHTTAPDLLVRLKQMAGRMRRPFSIHLAESTVEVDFLEKGIGAWADFLTRRAIDHRDWGPVGKRPVQYSDSLGLLDHDTLAVHLIECEAQDLRLLAHRGVSVCACPRSNARLHGKIADIPAMLAAGIRPCLGTDSLASNDSLNLFDEMRFTARMFPSISPREILAMATINGACALGFEGQYGRIAPGAQARFLYMPEVEGQPEAVMERIVCGDPGHVVNICNNILDQN